MSVLAFDQLNAALGGRRILSDISLSFGAGELVGIMGPNGAGKSTLLRTAVGFLPPAGGSVSVLAKALKAWPRKDLARIMSYLPQGGPVHWPMTVRSVVALGRLPYGRAPEKDEVAIAKAMAACEVDGFADRPVSALSGGERARVLLARALAVEAPILLADEPFAQLDPAHQLHAMEMFKAEARRGTLVLVVLHDLSVAARFCDRIVLLGEGKVAADGPVDAVLTRENLSRTFGVDALIGAQGEARYVVPIKRSEAGEQSSRG